jgi:hypothetical protein
MFKATHWCLGRFNRSRFRRRVDDAVCRLLGHNLWRVIQSETTVEGHSLPHYATFCQRCYMGGHVEGDYRYRFTSGKVND